LNSNNYAVLPSVAAAWLVSSESFMKGSPVDVLKLKASYGLSGNDDIGNYTARQYYVPQNLLGMEGLVRGGFGNEELQWEKVKKLNAGADVAFLNERINFSVDVFKNKTTNMIAYESVPVASGLPYAITNSAGMTTKGIEGSINTRVLNGTSFKWDLGLTIGRSKSTIDRLPSGDVFTSFAGATYLTRVGNTPNLFYGFRTNGIYTNDVSAGAEGLSIRKADGTLVPFKGGDVRFIDKNSDHVIDDNDRGVIGDPNPDFFGAINTKLEYKRFSLDALFSFVKGNDIYNYTRNQLEAMSGVSNQTEAVLNRWKDNAHQTGIPRAVWGDPMGNARFSDRWIEDGSYFRFRTATLSYSMPFNSKFFKYGVVYVTGNNIFTLTHYKGYDPEFNASESVFGRGIDNALEPQFRSVQLGLRIGL
jgi:hypothetical protein